MIRILSLFLPLCIFLARTWCPASVTATLLILSKPVIEEYKDCFVQYF